MRCCEGKASSYTGRQEVAEYSFSGCGRGDLPRHSTVTGIPGSRALRSLHHVAHIRSASGCALKNCRSLALARPLAGRRAGARNSQPFGEAPVRVPPGGGGGGLTTMIMVIDRSSPRTVGSSRWRNTCWTFSPAPSGSPLALTVRAHHPGCHALHHVRDVVCGSRSSRWLEGHADASRKPASMVARCFGARHGWAW